MLRTVAMPKTLKKQKDTFLKCEGDAWFQRNSGTHADLERATRHDPLLLAYRELELTANNLLEIGASDGWRLECLRREHPAARCHGVDPSSAAVAAGRERYPQLHLEVGTADALHLSNESMDLIAFGFCLYLCDRADLFRIATEADRVLAPGGAIAIYDFHSDTPYSNRYSHLDGLASYKMDYAKLFTWNPAYQVQYQKIFPHPEVDGRIPACSSPDNQVAVTVLRRNVEAAWPVRVAKQ